MHAFGEQVCVQRCRVHKQRNVLWTAEAELEHAGVAHREASTRVEELEKAVEKVADTCR